MHVKNSLKRKRFYIDLPACKRIYTAVMEPTFMIRKNSVSFYICFSEKFQMAAHDVVFQASPWTFDPSLVNLFTTLSSGASLLIVPDSLKLLPHKLMRVLVDNGVSIIQVILFI